MSYILAGDISGTNTRVFVFDTQDYSIIHLEEYLTENITDFSLFLKEYLEEVNCSIDKMIFACAGKVEGNKISLTNSSLIIDAKSLKKEFDVEVNLINDFEAIAYGISKVEDKNLCEVIPSLVKSQKQLIIGAGTGLGGGVFTKNTLDYENLEAGHFLASEILINNLEIEDLIKFAKKYYSIEKIEIEDLLSGKGIEMINKYFTNEYKKPEFICDKQVFNLFFEIYANVINYFAKKYACSFVYVAGGIITKRFNEINEYNFTKYIDENLSVTLVLDYDVSLYGLIEYYKEKIAN